MNPAWTLQRRSELGFSGDAAVYTGMHTYTCMHAQNCGFFSPFSVFYLELLQSTSSKENAILHRNLE